MTKSEKATVPQGEPSGRKADILAAATELFMQKGYAATSMAALAAQVGIRKPSLYHHFDSKEDVFLACIQAGYGGHLDRLETILADPDMTCFDKLEEIQRAVYGAIVHSTAGRMSPIIAETTQRFPQIAALFHAQFIGPMHRLIEDFVVRTCEAGDFARVDPLGFLHIFFSVPVHLTMSRAMFDSVDDPDVHFDIEHARLAHLDTLRLMLTAR